MEHLKKVMTMKKVMKAMRTKKKNPVSLFINHLENIDYLLDIFR